VHQQLVLHGQGQGVDLLQDLDGVVGHARVGVVAGRVGGQGFAQARGGLFAGQDLVPQLEQLDLGFDRHLVVVFEVVGDAQQQVGQAHGIADDARQALDGERKRAAGGTEQFAVVNGHDGIPARALSKGTARIVKEGM
jgi:hypothetical protein